MNAVARFAPGAVRILGVRHHSPACARLVAHVIAQERPQAVLIEGPSDFNARLDELLLDHTLPLALYSYANEGAGAARCWFPLLEHSPEWIALRAGHAIGASLHFIDLPHWRYRAIPDVERRALAAAGRPPGRTRHARVQAALCRRFECDGDDALWDHLFESQSLDAPLADLAARLDVYFQELRGDDCGTEQDAAREATMAHWIAWAAARHERVLVVCGGWHQPVLERDWRDAPTTRPEPQQPANERAAGCYLVPYEHRQVDALGGYAAGLPSPMYYQWLWQYGPQAAGERAMAAVVERLRRAQVALSTADLLAFEHTRTALARLRGHAAPLRVDTLDGLLSTVVKEALPTPSPWSSSQRLHAQHHPVLREALLALTGDGSGRLHADTPLPLLLRDVETRLAGCGLDVQHEARKLVLDRRVADDAPRARLLWQLRCLDVRGVVLAETRAPRAARGLAPALNFEEHWRLQRDERWLPDLIEAAMHGATLESAARQCLLNQVDAAGDDPQRLALVLLQAVRAGLLDMGQSLAHQLHSGIAQAHDHGALAAAAGLLAGVVQAGFWGDDPRALLEGVLALIADRLLWLLEGRDGAGSAQSIDADVRATAVFDVLLRLDLPGLDAAFARATLARLARDPAKPPALRGAALGVTCQQQADDVLRDELLAVMRAMPARDALGDFLFGLFSCARSLACESDAIVRAVNASIEHLGAADFLVALPALRAAFGWFPPRERAVLAGQVADALGLAGAGRHALLALRPGGDAFVDARRVEARALAWASEIGVLP
jgi:hypothetical protein